MCKIIKNKSQWKSPVLLPSSYCLLVSAPLVQTQSVKKFQPPHPRLLSPCHLPPSCFFFFFLSLSTPLPPPRHPSIQTPASSLKLTHSSLYLQPRLLSIQHRHINPLSCSLTPGTDTSTFAIMLWKSRSKTDGLQVKETLQSFLSAFLYVYVFSSYVYVESSFLCVKCCTWGACCLRKSSCRLLNVWRDSACVKCVEGN